MDNKIEKRTLWCPIGKSLDGSGTFKAILSDTSIDRDNEFMGRELLDTWANDLNKHLPMLADHKNTIANLVGSWHNAQVVQKGDHYALIAEPHFYEGTPLGKHVKGLLEDGATLGLSVGAIPKKSVEVEKSNKVYKKWTEAELIEASLTPIPSNRNTYLSLAKSFDLNKEVKKMADEEKTEATTEEAAPVVETPEPTPAPAEPQPEPEDKPEPTPAPEPAPAEAEVKEEKNINEIETLKKQNADLEKKVKELSSRKSEMKAIAEVTTPSIAVAPPGSAWELLALSKGVKDYGGI